ncbi:hypothetical protein [Mesorhizobium sp.]|uniref:hypothetical protein n=1 Tax=Mesorhizobium sp. TaxID=1871066 RepID=UPI0025C33625|nr:hypothetical protein [Mesorhizobium sp.]
MKVRAKFRCDSITHLINSLWDDQLKQSIPTPARSIKMSPVYGNGDPNHENTKFWKASPSGSFEMNVVNAAAADMFEVGKTYYLDFTPAD